MLSTPFKGRLKFKEALRFWFKLGWISFGGTASHIALMHDFLVDKKKWISNSRFFHALSLCMLLPGSEAQQLANLYRAAKQIDQLPKGSLLLADDLYNSYAIFAMIQRQGCHLIVPGKRDRVYKTIEKIADGDEIVELSRNIPKWWQQDWELPQKLFMRRITFLSPVDGETERVQYTTLLDKHITKADIIAKYISRWDIEITIREVKTLMDINVIRSKSEDMVFKEITIALTAYNMMRKIIAKSVEKTDLSPQENIIQEFFEANKTILIDKKGRIYNRWSPGRYGQAAQSN